LWKKAARAARSWSAVDGEIVAVVSGGGVVGAWCRIADCGVAWCVGNLFDGLSLLSLGSCWVWGGARAAGYGVGREASRCIACRAVVVAASGVRAATGQGWKCGPASSRRGRRGVPWRRGCIVPRMLCSCGCACVLVTRRHRWSSVCRRCLPRHPGQAPGGRRLSCVRVARSRSSRSSLCATPRRRKALQIRVTLAGACPSRIRRAPISMCEGVLVAWSLVACCR